MKKAFLTALKILLFSSIWGVVNLGDMHLGAGSIGRWRLETEQRQNHQQTYDSYYSNRYYYYNVTDPAQLDSLRTSYSYGDDHGSGRIYYYYNYSPFLNEIISEKWYYASIYGEWQKSFSVLKRFDCKMRIFEETTGIEPEENLQNKILYEYTNFGSLAQMREIRRMGNSNLMVEYVYKSENLSYNSQNLLIRHTKNNAHELTYDKQLFYDNYTQPDSTLLWSIYAPYLTSTKYLYNGAGDVIHTEELIDYHTPLVKSFTDFSYVFAHNMVFPLDQISCNFQYSAATGEFVFRDSVYVHYEYTNDYHNVVVTYRRGQNLSPYRILNYDYNSNWLLTRKYDILNGDWDQTIYTWNHYGTEVADELVPTAELKIACYPNPSRGPVEIYLEANLKKSPTIFIYNLKGQKIRELSSVSKSTTEHTYIWDGNNEQGRKAGSGIYIVQATSERKQGTAKIILLK